MKTKIKLLAFLSITATGLIQAAPIANYSVSQTDNVTTFLGPSFSGIGYGSGTATLDDSGLLTMLLTDTINLAGGLSIYTMQANVVITGSLHNGLFTPEAGSATSTYCGSTGFDMCGALPFTLGTVAAFNAGIGGSLLQSGGTLTSSLTQYLGNQTTYSTYVLTPSFIPVPATAWLFGSGLLGLTGIARGKFKAV